MNRQTAILSPEGGTFATARAVSSLAASLRPGDSLLPKDFPSRLSTIKESFGLSWTRMAIILGVDRRQLDRWRRGVEPSGGAMLALCRLASHLPHGVDELIAEFESGASRRFAGSLSEAHR